MVVSMKYLDVNEVFCLVDGTDPGIHDGVLRRNASRPVSRRAQNLHSVLVSVCSGIATQYW